jgi:guanine deaminase
LLEYAVSPRFAVSCTEKLMRTAAELAQKYGTYIQTHLSENHAEMEKVRHLFAQAADYTDVYAQYGLLGRRPCSATACNLNDRERAAIAASGAGVAHCPTANLFLRSGILPLDKMRALAFAWGSAAMSRRVRS